MNSMLQSEAGLPYKKYFTCLDLTIQHDKWMYSNKPKPSVCVLFFMCWSFYVNFVSQWVIICDTAIDPMLIRVIYIYKLALGHPTNAVQY